MMHEPRDPNFESRVRASFAKQSVMRTIGASLDVITPGRVVIGIPFRSDLEQQHGFLHAGIIATVLDSACGYAALTLMEPGAGVLTVEFKIQLMKPAAGAFFRAEGAVTRAGRTITFVQGECHAVSQHEEQQTAISGAIAALTGTMLAVQSRPGIVD